MAHESTTHEHKLAQPAGADGGEDCAPSARVRQELIDAIPRLRAFAISLSGKPERADDLVQETLIRAWSKLSSFTEGTNMTAWLYTILRNVFYSDYRKRRREVEDVDGRIASLQVAPPPQMGHMNMRDFREALMQLPDDQREALVLVGGAGLSYEEAADVCGCALGTIKSRVNRARTRLAQLLTIDSANDIGPDPEWQGVLDQTSSPGSAR